MKDIHTYGKEMARNGRTKDIYKGTFVCIQTLVCRGLFIYYVSTLLGFLDPPSPLRKHVFMTEYKQKLAISDPTLALQV